MISLKHFSHIPIKICIDNIGEVKGELIRFHAPRSVEKIIRQLPIEGRARLMRGGIYFQVPLTLGREKASKKMCAGTIAFWPLSSAICFFHEETSMYSPINQIGLITENIEVIRKIKMGMKITLRRDS